MLRLVSRFLRFHLSQFGFVECRLCGLFLGLRSVLSGHLSISLCLTCSCILRILECPSGLLSLSSLCLKFSFLGSNLHCSISGICGCGGRGIPQLISFRLYRSLLLLELVLAILSCEVSDVAVDVLSTIVTNGIAEAGAGSRERILTKIVFTAELIRHAASITVRVLFVGIWLRNEVLKRSVQTSFIRRLLAEEDCALACAVLSLVSTFDRRWEHVWLCLTEAADVRANRQTAVCSHGIHRV